MRRWLLPLILLFAVLGLGGAALAADPGTIDWSYEIDPTSITQPECLSNADLQGTLSARAIACIRVMTYTASHVVVRPIAKFMMPIALAVILLAIVLFGVRLTMGGVRAPKGEALLLIIKASFVMIMLGSLSTGTGSLNIGNLAIIIQDQIMDWGSDSFTTIINNGTGRVLEECQASQDPDTKVAKASFADRVTMSVPVTGGSPVNLVIETRLWNTLDCTIGMLFGMVRGVAFWSGVAALIMATVMSGPLGIAIFMGAILTFFTIVLYVIRCIFYIMHAYLAIGVILMFVPLVIPTIMFRRTLNYFTKWVFIYLGIIFQPLVLVIFMGVSIYGVSYFIVGKTGAGGTTAPRSNITNTEIRHVYSLWEILGFDHLKNSDAKVQAEMRRLTLLNMVRSDGTTLFDIMNASDLSNISDFLGKENVRDLLKLGSGGKQAFENMFNTFKQGKSLQDIMRTAQNISVSALDPIYMPTIDLRPLGTYSLFLKKLKGEATAVPANDGLTPAMIKAFNDAGYGSKVWTDPKTGKEYFAGPHPYYITSVSGDVDGMFQQWFLQKLCATLFSAFIMLFIFISLNRSVPEIARAIAGNGGIAITRGMASLAQRDGRGDISRDSGVPLAERLESFLSGTETQWQKKMARTKPSADWSVKATDWVRTGFEGGTKSFGQAAQETEVGDILGRLMSDAANEMDKKK